MEIACGFFADRHPLSLKQHSGSGAAFVEYANVSPVIGVLVSSRIATLHELKTVYGVRDAYDLLEVVTVDNYNNREAQRYANPNR